MSLIVPISPPQFNRRTFERNSSLGYHNVVWNGPGKTTYLHVEESKNCIPWKKMSGRNNESRGNLWVSRGHLACEQAHLCYLGPRGFSWSFSSQERQRATKRRWQAVTASRVALFFWGSLGSEYICASSGKILAAELAEQEENRETTVTKLLLNRNLEKFKDPVTSMW